jgi:prepilin-type N-terminal cleavage/methylation domain-containing protein
MNKGLHAKVNSVEKQLIEPKRRHVLYPPCRFSHQGFTLIELIVIIAVIGLLAAITALSIPSWRANISLRTTARDVISSFQFARVEAAKRNSDIQVQVTVGGAGVGGCTVFDGGEVIRILDLPARVSIVSATGNPYVFNTRGIPTSGGGTVKLTNGERTYDVVLSSAGAISMSGPG